MRFVGEIGETPALGSSEAVNWTSHPTVQQGRGRVGMRLSGGGAMAVLLGGEGTGNPYLYILVKNRKLSNGQSICYRTYT